MFLSLKIVTVTLLGGGTKVFADVIKNLEMRVSWITQVGPKSNNESL